MENYKNSGLTRDEYHIREGFFFCAWTTLCAEGNIPKDIPERPDIEYKKEWKGWADWFGSTAKDWLGGIKFPDFRKQ